jgi:hypothetical protein
MRLSMSLDKLWWKPRMSNGRMFARRKLSRTDVVEPFTADRMLRRLAGALIGWKALL